MKTRIGINGFGRMGRLALRAGWDFPEIEFVHLNETVDYKDDPRSSIIDAPSTMVTNGTQVKILAWYDNEWGYASRYAELARKVAREL